MSQHTDDRSPDHLDELMAVRRDLAPMGVMVLEHHYHPLSFGSFVVIIGTTKQRIRLTWDGRDRFLTVEKCCLQNQNSIPAWQLVSDNPEAHPLLRLVQLWQATFPP